MGRPVWEERSESRPGAREKKKEWTLHLLTQTKTTKKKKKKELRIKKRRRNANRKMLWFDGDSKTCLLGSTRNLFARIDEKKGSKKMRCASVSGKVYTLVLEKMLRSGEEGKKRGRRQGTTNVNI